MRVLRNCRHLSYGRSAQSNVRTRVCLQVPNGTVPNQHGTWLYGRAGWCPGGAVQPWLVDVTGELRRPGEGENVVTYKGLYEGADPVIGPNATAGYIMMTSQIVFYQ